MRAAMLLSAFMLCALCAGASASSRSLLQAIPPEVQAVVSNYSTLAAQQVLNATNGNQGAAQVGATDAANAANDAARAAVAAGRQIQDVLDSAVAAAEVSIAENVANTTSVLARSQNSTITPFNGSIPITLQDVLQQAGANASEQVLANGGNRTFANAAANLASQQALSAYNDATAAGATSAAAIAAASGAAAGFVTQLRTGTNLDAVAGSATVATDTALAAVNETLTAIATGGLTAAGLTIPSLNGSAPGTSNSSNITVNVTQGGSVPAPSPAPAPSSAGMAAASSVVAVLAAVLALAL